MRRMIAAFASNLVFANILLGGIVMAGVMAGMMMIREFFPEMSVDVVMVHVPYPGADPEEVEEGISRKIEEEIDTIEGIKRYTTHSSEGMGTCAIEVEEDYDMDDVKERIRNAIDSISTFPVDAEQPIIEELIHKQEVMLLTLWGDVSERTLKEWSEQIKDELRRLPQVSQVETSGAREYEIAIELSEERLREYGLSLGQVADAVRASSLNSPGGTIRSKGEEVRLRTVERKYWGGEFGNIVVMTGEDGEIVRLSRLATIDDGFTEDPVLASFNGRPCVVVQILNTPEEDAIEIATTVKEWVATKTEDSAAGCSHQRVERFLGTHRGAYPAVGPERPYRTDAGVHPALAFPGPAAELLGVDGHPDIARGERWRSSGDSGPAST